MSTEASAPVPSAVRPTFQIVRQPRLRDGLVQQLVESIVRGGIPAGATLPTEIELIQQFGVSRTVVREALKALEEKGLVHVQQGRGTIVLGRDRWDVLDPAILGIEMEGPESDRLFSELTEVRLALECQMAEQAATRASDEQLQQMEALLDRMRGLKHLPDEYLDLDVTFHDMVIQAAENRIAEAIMQSMHEPLRWIRRVASSNPRSLEIAQEAHEAIFEQLHRRDPEGARDAMRNHLVFTWRAWRIMMSGESPEAADTDGAR